VVIARYGFQEQPDVPAIVREAAGHLEAPVDLRDIAYFLSKIAIVETDAPGMAPWRKRLFLATAHIAADATEYFQLPRHGTVILGSAIEI
jgi:KUP system potassium uptake protein